MVPARVVDVSEFHASVDWPWGRIDPDSQFRWNGQHAFARSADSDDWIGSLFRTEPEPWNLVAASECKVGIPETIVQVIDIYHYDLPQDIGWLPRPHTMLTVIPADHPEYADLEDAGDTIDIPSAAPITIERAT